MKLTCYWQVVFSNTELNHDLTPAEKLEVLSNFINENDASSLVQESQTINSFLNNIQIFKDQLTSSSPQQLEIAMDSFSTTMLASLPGRLDLLNASLNADYVSLDSLPEELKSRWISPQGNYLLNITPSQNLNDSIEMRRFVEELYKVDKRLTGPPVINIEAGDAVIDAFKQALTYAIIAIAFFLLILLPNKKDSLLVLSTLLFAAIVTGGISVVVNIPLNFANIIALPLLLGIGVDSAIHILHRFRGGPHYLNIIIYLLPVPPVRS